jgi:hypothetical protein
MKKIPFLLLCFIFYKNAIGQSNEISLSYQNLLPLTQFHIDAATHEIIDYDIQFGFMKGSSLPNELSILEWKKKHSITEAMNVYKEYIEKNRDNQYLDVFQQYAGWLMITKLDMLSDTSCTNVGYVDTLLSDLVKTRYSGYKLLYYCLLYLKNYSCAKAKVNEYAFSIIDYGLKDSSFNDSMKKYAEEPSSDDPTKDVIRKYYVQKVENRYYLDSISYRFKHH